MPPDEIKTATGPEIPGETSTTATAAAVGEPSDTQPGLFGRIGNKIALLAAESGVPFRKGRGRPRKDGQPGKGDVVLQDAPAPSGAPGAAPGGGLADVPTLSQRVFHRSIIGGAKAALKGLASYCRNLAARAGMQETWISRNMAAADPEPQALEDWSESLRVVLEKHKVNTENSPEISLAINTGILLSPYGAMIFELRKEIAQQRAARGQGVED